MRGTIHSMRCDCSVCRPPARISFEQDLHHSIVAIVAGSAAASGIGAFILIARHWPAITAFIGL